MFGAFCLAVVSLWHGYHTYLRMPHALWIVVASQAIAVLATLCVALGLTDGFTEDFLHPVLRALGVW